MSNTQRYLDYEQNEKTFRSLGVNACIVEQLETVAVHPSKGAVGDAKKMQN
jgi:hypothetical protein